MELQQDHDLSPSLNPDQAKLRLLLWASEVDSQRRRRATGAELALAALMTAGRVALALLETRRRAASTDLNGRRPRVLQD